MPRNREYDVWAAMIQRCHNRNNPGFANYGGRGIRVCVEWRGVGGFNRFVAHIGPRPSPRHSLDRIDNNGNYEPGNVRWASRAIQARNTSRNARLLFEGEIHCLTDWATRVGVPDGTLRTRLRRGWTPETALQSALQKGPKLSPEKIVEARRIYSAGGVSMRRLASMFGIGKTTACSIVSARPR